MQKTLTVGRTYAVTTSSTCDVTDANGTLITTASAGQQAVFVAPTSTVNFSDDSASVVAVFKLALAKTRLLEQLGGGRNLIPALFLESSGGQYCVLNYTAGAGDDIDFGLMLSSGTQQITGSGAAGYKLNITQYSETWMRLSVTGSAAVSTDFRSLGAGTQLNAFLHADGTYGVNDRTATYEPYTGGEYTHTQYLGSHIASGTFTGRYYYYNVANGGVAKMKASPAIDSQGRPCLFDAVRKTPYVNKNTAEGATDFIVGLTVEQARLLGKLSPVGGTLTVSLPDSIVSGETVTDAAVQAALDAAAAKGWTITIQTYTD